MRVATPRASIRRASASAPVPVVSTHPLTATRPSLASIPTAIRSPERPDQFGNELGAFGRPRADHDPAAPAASARSTAARVRMPPPNWTRNPCPTIRRPSRIAGFPGKRAIEVDNVDPGAPRRQEGRGGLRRIPGIHGLLVRAPLCQAHAPATLDVDGRIDGHGGCPLNSPAPGIGAQAASLAGSSRPATRGWACGARPRRRRRSRPPSRRCAAEGRTSPRA